MERSLFGFIIRYSKREQFVIAPLVVASALVYFFSLDLPKTIINQAIQGKAFPDADSTAAFLRVWIHLPQLLGGGTLRLFDGIVLERLPYLLALSVVFLLLIIVNGLLKLQINTLKGWMGERMLRRLRFVLLDHIFRFPLPRFRRVKSAELATMIKDEVEPLGGFIGEAIITPFFLGSQALTAVIFILAQHLILGLVAVGMVTVQAIVIPRMRRRLLVLSKQRQIASRQLAGRIAECVDGVVEIHAHDTSHYERADISSRLNKLFRIRFELYQRKFFIKFLNNFLSQLTPFLFYTVGGYLVIVGKLDLGALVAVIAAYKDLPGPVKELIDWDQQRLDVTIKYTQVVEQFTVEDLNSPEQQALIESPALPESGSMHVSNISLLDESGAAVVEGVSFDVRDGAQVAILGGPAAGRSELAQILARLLAPTNGTIEVGGMDITRAPEAVTGRAISYVGAASYLFPVSVRENLLYGLKHRPLSETSYEGDAQKDREFELREAQRTGNSVLDVAADWIDYAAAGVSGTAEMDARILEVLALVELEEPMFELGLRSAVDPAQNAGAAESALRARERMRERLNQPGIQGLVEQFDAARYNRNATLAENLLFGTPVGKTFDIDNLASNAYVRRVLDETGLSGDLLRTGHKLAETMVELFSGLPPGHEMFEQFSFIRHDDLGVFKEILARVADVGLDRLDQAGRNLLLALPFKLIVAKHRLGLIDEPFEARILDARRYFAANLPADMRDAVEFFDVASYNRAASLQDNILFGKIVTRQAEAGARIGALLREVLDELQLRAMAIRIALDYQVGVGGARLPATDRQKIAIGRAILKRPLVLVLDQSEAVLDPASQSRIISSVLQCRAGKTVLWVLQRMELGERFGEVFVLDRGRLVERGRYEDLKCSGGVLHKLMNAG